MKRKIQIIVAVFFAIALSACNKNEVEVVSQDTSYQLDPEYIFVDIPKKFGFDENNILYLSGQTNLTLNGKNDTQHTTIAEGNTITFKVKVKRALDKDVSIRFVKDDALLDTYVGEKENYKSFPENTYAVSEIKLPAGQTEAEVKLDFQNIDNLKETPGYLLPLRMEMVNPVTGLKISTLRYSVFVKLNIAVVRDNIDSSNLPVTGTLFNDVITFESNKPTGLALLNDGKLTGGTWYPSGTTTYLVMKLPKEETIKGIKINTVSGIYQLASFNVLVEESGGYVSHGSFATQQATTELFIKFKTPVPTKNIRFERLLTLKGSSQPDITEINLIK